MIASALMFLVFMAVKIKSLSSGGVGFLVKNSVRFILLSVSLLMLSVTLKYFTERQVIKSTINTLLNHKALVKVDGSLARGEFVQALGKAIESIIKFKDKGSHPTKRTDVQIYIGDDLFLKYILRQDSRDLNMYWISASSQNHTMDLGFIKLEQNILENAK